MLQAMVLPQIQPGSLHSSVVYERRAVVSRRFVAALALAALASVFVYAVLAIATDFSAVVSQLRVFPAQTFILMLTLAGIGFVVRGLRWGRLMAAVGYPVRTSDALYMHLSSQTMTITPGRFGEGFKAWLASEMSEVPLSQAITLVFVERVADLVAICTLSLGGLSLFRGDGWTVLVLLIAVVTGAALASSVRVQRRAVRALTQRLGSGRYRVTADGVAETLASALRFRSLSRWVPVSVFVWGIEGVALYICLRTMGFDGLSVTVTISAYAISTILGVLTLLPGGIGPTEASLVGILVAAGIPAAAASMATMMTRVSTLWWGVMVGWIVLSTRPRLARALLAGSTRAA